MNIFAEMYPIPVFYDLETTGLDVTTDAVVEIAARVCPLWLQQYDGTHKTSYTKALSEPFNQRVKPHRVIPIEAINIHGITNDMVKDCPPFAAAYAALDEFLQRIRTVTGVKHVLLIAHNNFKYDAQILRHECKRAGVDTIDYAEHEDTLYVLAEKFKIQRYEIALQTLARDLISKQYVQTHSALGDVDTLIKVVEKIRGKHMLYKELQKTKQR